MEKLIAYLSTEIKNIKNDELKFIQLTEYQKGEMKQLNAIVNLIEGLEKQELTSTSNLDLNDISVSSLSKIMVAPQFCKKCNPSTWGNSMTQYQTDQTECTTCGHIQNFDIAKDER